jgi:hypothetical protein
MHLSGRSATDGQTGFMNHALSPTWTRAVAIAGLLLTFLVSSAARADGPTMPAQTSDQSSALPPPGTYRLIRIGPQVLVREDDHGRFTMVEDPTAKRGRGQRLVALLLGVLTAGAVLTLGRNGLTSDVGGRAGPR